MGRGQQGIKRGVCQHCSSRRNLLVFGLWSMELLMAVVNGGGSRTCWALVLAYIRQLGFSLGCL
jgi:hypothetical protein